MKKTLMPLLIAAAVALSACGQDLSGGDWRTTGVVQAAGTISRSGADTDVLVCVHEGDAVFYRDSADQELFGQVVYPMDVQDPWDTFAAIDFADRNGDGDGDVAMTFTDSEGGDVWMVWFWDADTGEYVFQPEESGSTVTAEWLHWEDLAEDCTTWQGEDGGMLALRADEALYTYRTWYGRTGQGDLWDIGNRQVLLRYGDGSYLLARSGSGFLDRLGQPNAVERMDHRHERHDHLHFIGLQMADQVPFDVLGKLLVLLSHLLRPVLSENPLAGFVSLHDPLGRVGF